jgi:serine/threonine-protein kinase
VTSRLQPEVFGDFLLVASLATSNMAEVSLALRLGDRSGRTFVVKRPRLGERPSGRAAQAISREAEVLSAVRAPGIVALEAAGELAGLPYVAVELLRGIPLDALLAHASALPAGAAAAVALDLARALSALHAAGWVHGDLAPSNVIVSDEGEATLIDFGLAARIGERHAEIAGKPGYVAPEAVRAVPAVPAEDVYGWGVVVAECALGKRLFPERSLAEAAARADAPAAVEQAGPCASAALRALRRDPAVRPDARELVSVCATVELDREALAALVARASRSGKEAAPVLTPTAPMVVQSSQPIEEPAPERAARPQAERSPSSWRTLLVAVAIGAATLGVVVGRVSARAREGAISFSGTLPRKAQVELDGKVMPTPIDGSPVPVAPGRHKLMVRMPKGEPREYSFEVRAGETLVFVPVARVVTAPEDAKP